MGDWKGKAEESFGHSRVAPVRSPGLDSLRDTQASVPLPPDNQPRILTQAVSGAEPKSNREEEKVGILQLPRPEPAGALQHFKYEVTQPAHPRYNDHAVVDPRLMSAVAANLRPEVRRDSPIKESISKGNDAIYGFPAGSFPSFSSESSAESRDRLSTPDAGTQSGTPTYQWGMDYDLRSTPLRPSPQDWPLIGVGPHSSSDFDQSSSNATSYGTDESIEGEVSDSDRPYTSHLGVPVQCDQGHVSEISEITDAGDQQQLRQKQGFGRSSDAISEVSEREESLNLLTISPVEHELQTSIYEALETTTDSKASFLPKRQLYRVINPTSVARELKRHLSEVHTSEQIERYAEVVCRRVKAVHRGKEKIKSFRKIFALLVMVEAPSSILRFLEEDVSDLDLPLVWNASTQQLCRKCVPGETLQSSLKCFSTWGPFKRMHFAENQWKMLAPYFSKGSDGNVKNYILDSQHILPFIASDEAEGDGLERHGGFAKVFMVRIHKDHHNFAGRNLSDRGFAIKQLYNSNRESFQRELRILRKFSGASSDKHIVSLLASYEQSNKFHFVFYRAEGDLFKYWREVERAPPMKYGNVLWVAQQCAGIAKALLNLHRHKTFTIRQVNKEKEEARKPLADRHVQLVESGHYRVRSDSMQSTGVGVRPDTPTWRQELPLSLHEGHPRLVHNSSSFELIPDERYGRHGDINPGNILWYDDADGVGDTLKGTLKICDFGQAEFNSLYSKTKTRDVANTWTYRPPETYLDPKIIGQSYDIWCLGCVYLEFVVWCLGGQALLDMFVEERSSYDIFVGMDTDNFFKIERCRTTNVPEVMLKEPVTRFFDKLHCHPNCTEYFHELLDMIQHNMLEVKPKERKTCEEVRRTLRRLYLRCRKNERYATKKNPWSANTLTANPAPHPTKIKMTEDAKQIIDKQIPLHPITGIDSDHGTQTTNELHAQFAEEVPLYRFQPHRTNFNDRIAIAFEMQSLIPVFYSLLTSAFPSMWWRAYLVLRRSLWAKVSWDGILSGTCPVLRN